MVLWQIQHSASPRAVFATRTHPSCCILLYNTRNGALTSIYSRSEKLRVNSYVIKYLPIQSIETFICHKYCIFTAWNDPLRFKILSNGTYTFHSSPFPSLINYKSNKHTVFHNNHLLMKKILKTYISTRSLP